MPLLSPRRLLSTPDGDPNLPNSRIRVRRFAGPSGYVGRLDHVRIAHLTDIHVGRVTPFHVQRQAVALANAERPDLVVITGDFVCHSQIYLDQLTALMREFTAPVLTVLGNHDYWAGAGEVRHALIRGGAEVLSNQHTTVTIRNQALQVLGLDDAYTGHARREEALRGLRRDVPTLGLSHIAEEADGLWRHGVPLVLSGHTHGGQVRFPLLGALKTQNALGRRMDWGVFDRARLAEVLGKDPGGDLALYVTRGIGSAPFWRLRGVNPRLLCRPEVTLLTLHRAFEPAD